MAVSVHSLSFHSALTGHRQGGKSSWQADTLFGLLLHSIKGLLISSWGVLGSLDTMICLSPFHQGQQFLCDSYILYTTACGNMFGT